jgi:mercuric reductase
MSSPVTIAVLGGGSAGFTAARVAREFGARVILALGEQGNLASLCINAGCMPSKALFALIDEMHHARSQRLLRVEPRLPADYLAGVVAQKDRYIAGFRAWRDQLTREMAGKDFLIMEGNAAFVNPHTIHIRGQQFNFDAAIIATGSTHADPKLGGPCNVRAQLWRNEDILRNTVIPESLAVIGAGAVGLEFSLRYARLGTVVTLITGASRFLPRFPATFGGRLEQIYRAEGIRVLTGHRVVEVGGTPEGLFSLRLESAAGPEVVIAERVLLATGRKPNLDSLNIAAAGVQIDDDGNIAIEEDMRVRGKQHLFAAGDVAARRMVVHHAHIEAGIAAENAVRGTHRRWHKRSNLQVIFSDPEFAFAGLRPEDAAAKGLEIVSVAVESRDVGKLLLEGDSVGLGELYADKASGQLLGAGLLCRGASDLIHLLAYAIDHQHKVHELVDAEFYHPTRMEIVAELGDALCRRFGGTPFCRALE